VTRLPYESTKADRLLVSVSEHPKDIDWAFSEFERHRGAPSNKALQLTSQIRSPTSHRIGVRHIHFEVDGSVTATGPIVVGQSITW
jgi:hypothetical protein